MFIVRCTVTNVTKKTKRNAFFLFRLVFLVGNVRNRVDETGNVWFFYKKSTKHDDYFACFVFEKKVDETGYYIYKNTNISTQTLYKLIKLYQLYIYIYIYILYMFILELNIYL